MNVTVDDLLDAREDADAAHRDSLHATTRAGQDTADADYQDALHRLWDLLDTADPFVLNGYAAATL